MINAILLVRQDLLNQILGFKQAPDTVTDQTLFGAFANMISLEGQLGWWKDSVQGANTFVPVDLLLTEAQLNYIDALPGPRVEVLRVLNQDGTDYGQTVSYDDQGNKVISGNPIWADKTAQHLGDKAVFDNNGNQTGTTPMSYVEMPQWLGWQRY